MGIAPLPWSGPRPSESDAERRRTANPRAGTGVGARCADLAYRNVVDSRSAARLARDLGTNAPRLLRAVRRLGLLPSRTSAGHLQITGEDAQLLADELGVIVRIAGLRRSQVLTLAALARAPLGLRSARAVARAAGLSPTAASRALRELVEIGLVERRQETVAEGQARTVECFYANLHPRWPELVRSLAGVHLHEVDRPSPSRVPARLAHVFWNAPVPQIDPAVHGAYVARRVLRDGDTQALAWAADVLTAADWREAARARGLDPRRRALADNLAAGLA